MSHYTDQNPISDQKWMESVLSQMGGNSRMFKVRDKTGRGYSTKRSLSDLLSINSFSDDTDYDGKTLADWAPHAEVGDEWRNETDSVIRVK